jgi:hypothetical protein
MELGKGILIWPAIWSWVKDSQASLSGEWAGGTHENLYPAGADDRKSSGPIPMKEKLGAAGANFSLPAKVENGN